MDRRRPYGRVPDEAAQVTTLAIDPGLSGGLAWADDGVVFQPIPMPESEKFIVIALRDLRPDFAVIEDIPWMVKQRVNPASLSKLHRNCGVLHGCLRAMDVPICPVSPQVWQARFGVSEKTYAVRKRRLKEEAQRRYPDLKVTLDTADALLILDWALQETKLHEH